MKPTVNFFSEIKGEIKKFLELYYSKNIFLNNELVYSKSFENPIDMIELISCFIDNNDKFKINLWISIDLNVYICVTENNLNNLIKYLYERYP